MSEIFGQGRPDVIKARLAALVESSDDAIISKTLDGIITTWNKGAERMFGYRPDEAIGQPVSIVIPEELLHEEPIILEKLKRSERIEHYETVRRRKDGSLLNVSLTVSPILDDSGTVIGASKIARDITERRSADEALKSAHTQLNHLLDYSPAVFYALKVRGAGVEPYLVSRNMTELLGYEVAEIMTRDWYPNALHPDDRDLALAGLTGTIRDGSMRIEYRLRHKDGGYRFVEDKRRLTLDAAGNPEEMVGVWIDITERKEIEIALRKSEDRFREMLENVELIAIMLDMDGRLTFCNDYLLHLTGWSREEVISSNWFDRFIPQMEREELRATFRGIQEDQVLPHTEQSIRSKAGELREVQWNNIVLRNTAGIPIGVASIGEDITDRNRSAKALQEAVERTEREIAERTAALRASEARYSTLFHSTDEGFCIIKAIQTPPGQPRDFQFVEINPAFERQSGLSNAAVGHSLRNYAPGLEEYWFEIYGRVADTGEPVRFQNFAHPLGRHFDVYTCRIGGSEDGLVAIVFRDITSTLKMESALREAKERAESANLAKSEFLSRMSHELRTPMNSVLGYAQLLDLQYQEPKIKESATAILRAGRHLLELINEVLDLSRIESGQLAISTESVSVTEVLHQAMAVVRPMAESRQLELSRQKDIREDLNVEADRQRLLQVLINLLGNAVKYNRPGGKVEATCIERDDVVRFEIADTGIGISESDQPLLFEPFQRFCDQGIEGTGLGLALSKRFVDLMGGHLGLARSSPAGSTFFFELKAAPKEVVAQSGKAVPYSPLTALKGFHGKVLYIEDNPSNIGLLESVLADWPEIQLLLAIQGSVGIEMATRHLPDVILLDLHLPDMSGYKVLMRLKAISSTTEIPVIVLTADATGRQVETLIQAGALEYLTKPVDLDKLFQVLRRFLQETLP